MIKQCRMYEALIGKLDMYIITSFKYVRERLLGRSRHDLRKTDSEDMNWIQHTSPSILQFIIFC
jgi:hypothetical protein